MKLIKQPTIIKNINLDRAKANEFKFHSIILPNILLAIVCGRTGCGKTNAFINLIISHNGLKFKNLYIFSKFLYQSKYQFLKRVIKALKCIGLFLFSNNVDVTSLEEAKPFSVFVFDDVSCENQNIIRDYFSRGRHKFINCFYLSQTYLKIPKQLIRDNANFLIIFSQDERNLKHIYNEHVNSDMSFKEFLKMCHLCWVEKHGFLSIAKDFPLLQGRYRKGLSTYIQLHDADDEPPRRRRRIG